MMLKLKFYLWISFHVWNWYLIKDGEMLFCYCELIDIGIGLKIFRIDNKTNIEIDVGFVMLICTIVYTFTKIRIQFEDEYVYGLQTHLQIVPFLDNLRLVFSYELCCIFQLLLLFHAYFSIVSPLLFSRCGLYFIYVAHLEELRGDAAKIYTWNSGAIIGNNNAIHDWKSILNGVGPLPFSVGVIRWIWNRLCEINTYLTFIPPI